MTVHAVRLRMGLAQRRLVTMVKQQIARFTPYRPATGTQAIFDAEYANGRWDYLRRPTELPRFSVIAGYCHYYQPSSVILDVGCGEGILQESLCPSTYRRYVGIDYAQEAIQRAAHKQDAKTHFVQADAATYLPTERFNVIVFNECLYYFADPLGVVERYEPFLAPDGIYIVSMFDEVEKAKAQQIWQMLARLYTPEAETRLSTKAHYSWTIKLFQPSQRQQ